MSLKKISIKNFKSIKELKDFEFRNINILLGCNGAGKSNFISFFKLLESILNSELQVYCGKYGIDNILHYGVKYSAALSGKIEINSNGYSFELKPTASDSLFFTKEIAGFKPGKNWVSETTSKGGNHETSLFDKTKNKKSEFPKSYIAAYTAKFLSALKIYHFHDTGETSKMKLASDIHDNEFLREDASNLAAFLYYLQEKHPVNFSIIEGLVRQIAPYFEKFILKPNRLNEKTIFLEWKEKGNNKRFYASNLSDGTLRMICLITLLNQPKLPSVIIIDEPELGLHPAAIGLFASMIKSSSVDSQFLITTQSVNLINYFEPEDIVVVDRKENQSVFNRLSSDKLEDWLEEYSIGEIWEKNIIGGRP